MVLDAIGRERRPGRKGRENSWRGTFSLKEAGERVVVLDAIGSDAVGIGDLVRYLHALDEASDHVTLSTHGETHEGRTLYHLTITSVENHANLDRIRADNAKLADPRLLAGDAEAERILEELPGIAWLSYSIHGDEVSPCDSAMVVAYRLAAGTDEASRRMRDELVVLLDPLQNPDGRERYLAQIETLRGIVANTSDAILIDEPWLDEALMSDLSCGKMTHL